MFAFVWEFALPVTLFAFCYGRIIRVIRSYNKVVSGNVGQGANLATVPEVENNGQDQQQEAEDPAGGMLSRAEMNVLQTMITIIICFTICWAPASFASVIQMLTVCQLLHYTRKNNEK